MRKGRRLFYSKLAAQNIRKNRRFYFPYLLTGLLTVAMFYNVAFLSFSRGLQEIPGSEALMSMMGFGMGVVGIFAFIILLYANSFLMKRRQKEIGLYNILGMGKRHIGRVLLWESAYTYLIMVGGGLLLGILLSKLLLLTVCHFLFFTVPFGFEVSTFGIIVTAVLFACIELLALAGNMVRVTVSKPVELLRGGNMGEREPRTKWLLAVAGLVATVAGYVMAAMVESPLEALTVFFIAVLLVIFGTYCLFTAGSIAVLKLLRRNKRYYYQTRHFTAVSGLLYRMKQNAVGLASICILSTMVLVTVSTTVCLYSGIEDSLRDRYPYDVTFTVKGIDDSVDTDSLRDTVLVVAGEEGRTVREMREYRSLTFAAGQNGSDFTLDANDIFIPCEIEVMTGAQYTALTGQAVTLAPGEALAYCSRETEQWPTLTVGGCELRVLEWVENPIQKGEDMAYVTPRYYLVVTDETLARLDEVQSAAYGEEASLPSWYLNVNLDGTNEEIVACYEKMGEAAGELPLHWRGECREAQRDSVYALYGGLMFLGLFLGALFLMATVLIIYYKQISEGYEDNERFVIMQKVGMTREEVRASINSQVKLVFFLPLVVAVCHLAGCFHMMKLMLALFQLSNQTLFLVVTLITLGVFALGYTVVYALTSRTYYRIVSDAAK